MHDTTHAEPRDTVSNEDIGRFKKRNRVLSWLSTTLAVALVGLGGWVVFGDADSQSLTAGQLRMLETIDAYLEAWNTGDGPAADALMVSTGYLEDVGGRWYVADGAHARYLESLQSMGINISRSDAYAVGNVVLIAQQYAEGSTTNSPNVYYMSPDGTQIQWVIEPYPIAP